MDRVHGILAPGKGTVGIDQHRRDRCGIFPCKCLNDDLACLLLVLAPDFLVRHGTGAGHRAVEVVALGRAHGRDLLPSLCKRSRPAGVGMDNPPAVRESLVQLHMGGGVAARFPLSFHNLAVQVGYDHVLYAHPVIGDAGGLDHHQTARAVDPGDIAPGEGHKTVLRKQEIRFQNLLFQFFQHDVSS